MELGWNVATKIWSVVFRLSTSTFIPGTKASSSLWLMRVAALTMIFLIDVSVGLCWAANWRRSGYKPERCQLITTGRSNQPAGCCGLIYWAEKILLTGKANSWFSGATGLWGKVFIPWVTSAWGWLQEMAPCPDGISPFHTLLSHSRRGMRVQGAGTQQRNVYGFATLCWQPQQRPWNQWLQKLYSKSLSFTKINLV